MGFVGNPPLVKNWLLRVSGSVRSRHWTLAAVDRLRVLSTGGSVALTNCRRRPASFGGIRRSDHERELVKSCCRSQSGSASTPSSDSIGRIGSADSSMNTAWLREWMTSLAPTWSVRWVSGTGAGSRKRPGLWASKGHQRLVHRVLVEMPRRWFDGCEFERCSLGLGGVERLRADRLARHREAGDRVRQPAAG